MAKGGGDKRKVSTDALETLGEIIGPDERRDAIHLAVEPVEAAEKLFPGQDVGLTPAGFGAHTGTTHLGIVDPFLKGPVYPGQRFWLVVYPRQIHSLRHVWTHPAFPDDQGDEARAGPAPDQTDLLVHLDWLRDFADRVDRTYDELMVAAKAWLDDEEYIVEYGSETWRGVMWDHQDEFWDHYEAVTGQKVHNASRGNFFSCSC